MMTSITTSKCHSNFASPTTPKINVDTPPPPSDNISNGPSDDCASNCTNCLKLKREIEQIKEIWKGHCKSEVNRIREENRKKMIELFIKEKQKLLMEIETQKKKNADLAILKEENKHFERSIDLLLHYKQYRNEVNQVLDSLLNKQSVDIMCQTDEEYSTDTLIARIKEVDTKKGDLDAAIRRLDVIPNIFGTNTSFPNELLLISDQVPDSQVLKKKAKRCDTISPTHSILTQSQSPEDSDIEFIEELPAPPRPSTPEKVYTFCLMFW
ncbi:hypothetical protein Mgra_00003134 [Meloidogyne graminicola]|uniref:Uncharacterized protein n=1 Tax=Meloidogyne graminicola TaxID=189291 RepID=A0A8S9ZVV1_9BILA|nr:hypothetical protein Mgra_00003134 [Meloidogyne graminicola]